MDQQYYKKAVSYWDRQPADVDGVLGGFGNVSATDIRDSKRLLEKARTVSDQNKSNKL